MSKNLKNLQQEFFSFIKNYNLPIPRPSKRTRYRRSLQPSKENIHASKREIFSIFVGHFCFNGSGFGYGSADLIESRSNPDPDPKYWFEVLTSLILNSF
jgi:hypothetical protein